MDYITHSQLQHRIITDAFDYNARRNLEVKPDKNSARSLLARLRLDALIFDTIVLTDVQILHSLFFTGAGSLQHGKKTFGEQIPFSSIEIRTRRQGLSDTIVSLVRPDATAGKLSAHLFTYIDPAFDAREELIKFDASEVAHWRDVIRILRTIFGQARAEKIEQTERAWALWVEAERKGVLRTVRWQELPGFNFREEVNRDFLSRIDAHFGGETDQHADEIVDKLCSGEMTRGDLAATLIKEDSSRSISKDEYAQLETIEFLYSSSYNGTIATQHCCGRSDTGISISPTLDGNNVSNGDLFAGALRQGQQLKEVAIPAEFWVALSQVPGREFESLLGSMEERLTRWRYERNVGELESAIDHINERLTITATKADELNRITFRNHLLIPYLRFVKNLTLGATGVTMPILAPFIMVFDGFAEAALKKLSMVDRSRLVRSVVQHVEQRS